MNYIIKTLSEMKESFKKFKENKLWNISTISTILIIPLSLIWGMISMILFYIKNGFHFKFSSSIFSIYYNETIKYLFFFFCLLSLTTILILYFKESSKKSKILFFTSIGLIILSFALIIYFAMIEKNNFVLLFTFILLGVCFLPITIVYKTEITQIKTLVINSIIFYIITPLLLLVGSNLMPLVAATIFFGMISSISFRSSEKVDIETSKNTIPRNDSKKKIETSQKRTNKKIIEVPSGMKLYREKGTFTPDYIVQDNGLSSMKICTQEEFDKEKVIIIQDKNEIKYIGYRKK